MRITYFLCLLLGGLLVGCNQQDRVTETEYTTADAGEAPLPPARTASLNQNTLQDTIHKTEAEWRRILTPQEFYVLREKGTEPAFRNKYNANKKKGVYYCAGCSNPVFSSAAKFDSGTGWPSFWKPIANKRIREVTDRSGGMVRTEVVCARCGGHLGHVFPDGPEPTGLRYCLNSVALDFKASK